MRNDIKQNIQGLALLIPLLIIAAILIVTAQRDKRFIQAAPQEDIKPTFTSVEVDSLKAEAPKFSQFDPNKADYFTFIESGVPREIAVRIISWRERGKVFHIKEELALCYGMTDSIYRLLEPYIYISEEHRIKPYTEQKYKKEINKPEIIKYDTLRLDTVTAKYLSTIGFSRRQAEVVINYRNLIGGYRNIDEFKECYVVGDSIGEILRPYIIFDSPAEVTDNTSNNITYPIEINSADSTTLLSVRGIGSKSVVDIIKYRELLGGYYSVEQIAELEVVTEENFQKILQQIWCDSTKIKKININFASPKELDRHPYMTRASLRRLINHRQLKGGLSTVEELVEHHIFSEDQAKRIAPYLRFGTTPE